MSAADPPTTCAPAGIDALDDPIFQLDGWAQNGAPFDWFAARRLESPVYAHARNPHAGAGAPQVWSVLVHTNVVQLGRCPDVLSSD